MTSEELDKMTPTREQIKNAREGWGAIFGMLRTLKRDVLELTESLLFLYDDGAGYKNNYVVRDLNRYLNGIDTVVYSMRQFIENDTESE